MFPAPPHSPQARACQSLTLLLKYLHKHLKTGLQCKGLVGCADNLVTVGPCPAFTCQLTNNPTQTGRSCRGHHSKGWLAHSLGPAAPWRVTQWPQRAAKALEHTEGKAGLSWAVPANPAQADLAGIWGHVVGQRGAGTSQALLAWAARAQGGYKLFRDRESQWGCCL